MVFGSAENRKTRQLKSAVKL